MSTELSMKAGPMSRPVAILLGTGLLVATLDAVFACTFWQLVASVPVPRIFQGIAAGLLGKASFQGGATTAWLGALLHYAMAMVMVLVYYVASGWWPVLARRPWVYGALYGLAVYVVMTEVVVPLSAAAKQPHPVVWVVSSVLVHMLVVGVPSALAARAARGV